MCLTLLAAFFVVVAMTRKMLELPIGLHVKSALEVEKKSVDQCRFP